MSRSGMFQTISISANTSARLWGGTWGVGDMHRREGGVWPKRGAQIIRIKGPGAAANRRQSRYNVATPGSQRFETVGFGELSRPVSKGCGPVGCVPSMFVSLG
jgi:hypothetical protein